MMTRRSAFLSALAIAFGYSAAGAAFAQDSGSLVANHVLAQKRSTASGGEPRVLGGTPAKPAAYPWQVALAERGMLSADPMSQFEAQFCGGSLIAPKWVLTAAHCVSGAGGAQDVMPPEELVILYGDVDLREAKRADVIGIEVHPDYNAEDVESDIALVELATPLKTDGREVGIIDLAEARSEQAHARPGTAAIVTGWGAMGDAGYPVVLQEASLELQDRGQCSRSLLALYERQFAELVRVAGMRLNVSDNAAQQAFQTIVQAAGEPVPPTMLCAGIHTGERDSCGGDSGGPLVVSIPGGYVQVGIVSWGEVPLDASTQCGHEQLYGYYTRVSSFSDWIKETFGR